MKNLQSVPEKVGFAAGIMTKELKMLDKIFLIKEGCKVAGFYNVCNLAMLN